MGLLALICALGQNFALAEERKILWDLVIEGNSALSNDLIEEAIASLPAAHREALLLVAVEGMKPGEAAAVCGITPEAMRQRLSRARAAIASHLDECDDTILVHLKAVTT